MSPNDHPSGEIACPCREELAAFQQRQVSPARQAAIDKHLLSCPRCAALLHDLEAETGSCLVRFVATRGEYEDRHAPSQRTNPRAMPVAWSEHNLPWQLGQYEVVERLGKGGMGAVYRARHTRLKRWVALKIISADRMQNPCAVFRFQREMEAIGRLTHRNIVRATDAGEVDGIHFLVMDLVDGLDLSRVLRQNGPVSLADASEVGRQAALGLQSIHESGLVHRDIKPSNLILTRDGEVKILDLGLALLHGAAEGTDLTGSGQLLGTADYMAPEQWNDTHAVDIRGDLYSLGCTLYKMLTGEPPFNASAPPAQKKMAHVCAAVPPIRERRPDLPLAFAALQERLLAKNPEDRFATPAETAAALEPFTTGSDLRLVLRMALARAEEGESGQAALRETQQPRERTPAADTREHKQPADGGRRRNRLGLIALGSVLTASLVVTGGLSWWRTPGPATVQQGGEQPAEVLEVGKWSVLLNQEPRRLLPKRPTVDYFTQWEGARQTFRSDSPGRSLFELGTTGRRGYRFQVGMTQSTWAGRAGIFLGYRPTNEQGKGGSRFQVIEVCKNIDRAIYTVDRYRVVLGTNPAGKLHTESVCLGRCLVFPPVDRQENTLDVEVLAGRVDTIIWNGKPLPELVGPDANQFLNKDDHNGTFGICNTVSHCVFRSARFMPLTEENK